MRVCVSVRVLFVFTPAMIVLFFPDRKAVLLYHPDKSQFKRDKAVFLTIQDAYNTLSSAQKRRAYDSSLPFDDSIPTAEDIENDDDFYKV